MEKSGINSVASFVSEDLTVPDKPVGFKGMKLVTVDLLNMTSRRLTSPKGKKDTVANAESISSARTLAYGVFNIVEE